MPKFLLMVNHDNGVVDTPMTEWAPEEIAAHMNYYDALGKELEASGELIQSTGLADPRLARIVRSDGVSNPMVTDGPLPESKEVLAGFQVVDVESETRAVEIAARVSAVPGPAGIPIQQPVEVRRVIEEFGERAVSGPPEDLRQPGAQELLRTHLTRLAYSGADGFPRVIPIGFWWDGERIVMTTAPNAPKVRALAARPQVALTIDIVGPPAKALFVRGLATIEIVPADPDGYIAASTKDLDEDRARAFGAHLRSAYEGSPWARQTGMARISIEPSWARYYDFGSSRLPDFLRQVMGL